jgi:CRP/FNR family transcriptional regulator
VHARLAQDYSLGPVIDYCSGCGRQQQCLLGQHLPYPLGTGTVQRRETLSAGSALFRQGAPFRSLFMVCRGAVKTQRVTPEGGMVVTAFHLPGEFVGLDALGEPQHCCDALTTVDAEVCKLNVARLFAQCASRPAIHAWLIACIGAYLRQKDADLSWATRMRTDDRVLRFFVGLHRRLNGPLDVLCKTFLPMKKQDIARYLHMTPETLSRNLARLRDDGLLQLQDDHFTLPDPQRALAVTRL